MPDPMPEWQSKVADWVLRNVGVLVVLTGALAIIYIAHLVQFIVNFGRLPVGSGELWNWILGL